MKKSFFVDGTNLIRILKERFDFRCERDAPMMNAVIQRLDADTVANQPQAARLCIPERDSEHAAKSLQTFDAPLFKGLQDNLGVRVIRFPAAPSLCFKLAPDLRVVIDLAVKDNLQRPIPIAHGL